MFIVSRTTNLQILMALKDITSFFFNLWWKMYVNFVIFLYLFFFSIVPCKQWMYYMMSLVHCFIVYISRIFIFITMEFCFSLSSSW
jgi:hypothetical protein